MKRGSWRRISRREENCKRLIGYLFVVSWLDDVWIDLMGVNSRGFGAAWGK
jgi:hypothetical protein